jgi:type I restriction enzyme R subunit
MKELMPSATFIGFTGTPLLKEDKANNTSVRIFGPYIHVYRYDEAVADGVVLDLRYEARDIDQRLVAPEKVDQWFEAKTQNLTDIAKAQVKRRWGTMQRVLSAKQRLDQIVADISFDMDTKPRLMDGHGNALLVSESIYNACRFYDLFQKTPLKGHCAIITSGGVDTGIRDEDSHPATPARKTASSPTKAAQPPLFHSVLMTSAHSSAASARAGYSSD